MAISTPRLPLGCSPYFQRNLTQVCAHTPTHTGTHSCTHTQRCRAVCTSTRDLPGLRRSGHLPARCVPAVNQCLEGAAGAGTPGEIRAAKGRLGFPQPLTVAARTVPGGRGPRGPWSLSPVPKRPQEGIGHSATWVKIYSSGQSCPIWAEAAPNLRKRAHCP